MTIGANPGLVLVRSVYNQHIRFFPDISSLALLLWKIKWCYSLGLFAPWCKSSVTVIPNLRICASAHLRNWFSFSHTGNLKKIQNKTHQKKDKLFKNPCHLLGTYYIYFLREQFYQFRNRWKKSLKIRTTSLGTRCQFEKLYFVSQA